MNTEEIITQDVMLKKIKELVNVEKVAEDYFQLIMPFYHSDGDGYEIFIHYIEETSSFVICDKGMTLMRLSYAVDTSQQSIVQNLSNILQENEIYIDEEGELSFSTVYDDLVVAINKFASCISKVMGLTILT